MIIGGEKMRKIKMKKVLAYVLATAIAVSGLAVGKIGGKSLFEQVEAFTIMPGQETPKTQTYYIQKFFGYQNLDETVTYPQQNTDNYWVRYVNVLNTYYMNGTYTGTTDNDMCGTFVAPENNGTPESGILARVKADMISESYSSYDKGGNFKYLLLTYSGDVSNVWFEFLRTDSYDSVQTGDINQNMPDALSIVASTPDKNYLNDEDVQIAIDLEASGIRPRNVENIYLHAEDGEFTIKDARLSNSYSGYVKGFVPEETTQEPTTQEPTTSTVCGPEFPEVLYLDGDENGQNSMIGTYTAPVDSKTGLPKDSYKYLGYVSFKGMVPDEPLDDWYYGNYRYLVMTYTGDITKLRFAFVRKGYNDDGSDDEFGDPFWFNPEGQTHYFVGYHGSDIPLVGDNTTVIIDLAQTVNPDAIDGTGLGVELDWYNSGIHMHCDEMLTHGNGEGFTISQAYLATNSYFTPGNSYSVSVDDKNVGLYPYGAEFTIPNDTVGYYIDGKLYGPGMKYKVTEDVNFEELKMQFNIAKGAALKYTRPASLRFQAKVNFNKEEAFEGALKERGMLITKSDYVDNLGDLNMSSKYQFVKVKSTGWYDSEVGKYCATLVGIKSQHNFLDYRARAYATLQYADGSTRTFYSKCTNPCNVGDASYKIKKNKAIFDALSDDYKAIILENLGL
jgi:hypothetical protein